MGREWDQKRQIYRTEAKKANWFTYALMFVLAFAAGAAGGTFAAFRFSAGTALRRSSSDYRLESAPQDYSDVAVWAMIGGAMAMAVLAKFIWSDDED